MGQFKGRFGAFLGGRWHPSRQDAILFIPQNFHSADNQSINKESLFFTDKMVLFRGEDGILGRRMPS